MANIFPFPAVRFNTDKVKLEDVLTQPYDKITPEMQTDYYAASPHNLIRLELGKVETGDDDKNSVYTRAARFLTEERRNGTLISDRDPSIYAYSQAFEVPGAPGKRLERRGFIALGQLQDYGEQMVYRHEQTLSKPKADRLNLLRATRTHSGQIFMLYSDPAAEVEKTIWTTAQKSGPTAAMNDEYGVLHQLWRIADPAVISVVREKMRDKKLIIADGHHRYETALAYRNERRGHETEIGRGGHAEADKEAPYEKVMMTLINMDSPGLLILPTHRVVFGLKDFSAAKMLESARAFFEVEKLQDRSAAESATSTLSSFMGNQTAFVAATQDGSFLLKARKNEVTHLLGTVPELQRQLDVVQLHKVLLEHVLGISEEDIRNQTYLNYLRGAEEAMERVRGGAANVAFLMNPVSMEQMSKVAFAEEVMPQKSTDFYPKLMSGLALYAME